jgi:hypothetical protein
VKFVDRETIEGAIFDRLGRPTFFNEGVGMMMVRIVLRAKSCGLEAEFTVECLRLSLEVRRLVPEIELRFVETGMPGIANYIDETR